MVGRNNKLVSDLDGSLEGQFLIAMPTITDGCFARSVVYVCAHSREGAMGLIINNPTREVGFQDVLRRLQITGDDVDLPPPDVRNRSVIVGGPVESGRGFVLHSPDYFVASSTVRVANDVCLTATLDILKAMLDGTGPTQALLALGYSGWGPGQLESEFRHNGWLNCAGDPDLIFDDDHGSKYQRALSGLGIDPSHLVGEAGHA
ncbi:MAG: YqgE/AlgH family protein [Hyphomicrobiaceae bacterium]